MFLFLNPWDKPFFHACRVSEASSWCKHEEALQWLTHALVICTETPPARLWASLLSKRWSEDNSQQESAARKQLYVCCFFFFIPIFTENFGTFLTDLISIHLLFLLSYSSGIDLPFCVCQSPVNSISDLSRFCCAVSPLTALKGNKIFHSNVTCNCFVLFAFCLLPYNFRIHCSLSVTFDKVREMSKTSSFYKAVKTRAWV